MKSDRRYQPVLLGAFAVLAVCSIVGTAFAPALLAHSPLALIALSPTERHLLLAATLTSPGAFVTITVIRRTLSAATVYGLGRIYEDRAVDWMKENAPEYTSLIDRCHRGFHRAGPVLLFVFPGLIFSGFAGISGMGPVLFLTLMVSGTTAWMIAIYYVGESLAVYFEPIVSWITEHVVEATVASVVLVLIYQAYRRSRGGGIPKVPPPPSESDPDGPPG